MSVVRTCDGKAIKATNCIIKVAATRGNITWHSSALRGWAYKQISAWQPLLPFAKGLSFTFMQESVVFLLIPTYSLVGKHHVMERSRHIWPFKYISSWIIIVDITLKMSMLGGETISPYLYMCPVETFCSSVCGEC